MTTPGREGSRFRRLKAIAKFVGIRLVALIVLGLIAFLALADVGSLFRRSPWSDVPPTEIEPADSTGPGWPHRRGPGYNAISSETDLADSWPAEGPPLLWTQPCGRGYSGATLVGNRLFTQTQSLTAQDVECRDADTGALIWRHRSGWPYEPAGLYPGPRTTPTWHEGRVYFADPYGLVGCLDAVDGTLLWQINVNEEFDGSGTGFGYACSPLVEEGKVILPVGGEGASVVALDADDGSTVWASGDEPASYCSALPFEFRGRRCVVAFLQNALALFDLETGTQLGIEPYSSGYDEHAAAPLYDEPYLMAASPFRAGAICYRLESPELKPAEEGPAPIDLVTVWANRRFSNDTASSVLLEGHVYGFDLRDAQAKVQRPSRGKFKCLDFATGETQWETDQIGHATVVAADGKLFLFVDTGELILARATPDRFEELGRSRIFQGEICWTAPALHRGRLYLRSPAQLACVYVGQPEDLNEQQRQTARPASMKPASSKFDLGAFVGGEREYLFDPADGAELWLWYRYSLIGVLGLAAVAAGLSYPVLSLRRPDAAPRATRAIFWIAAFVFGVLGTPVFNRWTGTFIFTWPVCLFVAHQVAVNTIVWSGQLPRPRRAEFWSLLAGVFFLATCLAYYLVCRRLSLATEWAFLLGFLPSWAAAVPTAYRFRHDVRLIGDLLWALLSFTLFFWAAGTVLFWKAAML